ncbi:MAG: MerR family transcriptional regulator [Solirubrobacteraceae bacterium]
MERTGNGPLYNIGEVARATGVSVRALRHYDELGLLIPEQRTVAGHRRYGGADLRRLYEILALRELGLSLREVASTIEGGGADLRDTVRRQLERVDAELQLTRRLRDRLIQILAGLEETAEVDGAGRGRGCGSPGPTTTDYIEAIEVMTMIDSPYTPDQQAKLAERRTSLGESGAADAERAWVELIAALEAQRAAGTDPADLRVQTLAGRWRELIEAFTGGDPGITASLRQMYANRGRRTHHGEPWTRS